MTLHYPKQVAVNKTDLELAIREGCMPMQKLFDPQNDNLPYFGNLMSGEDKRNSHFTNYSVSHIPGRWLNALLNAEDLLHIPIAEGVIENLARCTYKAFSPPVAMTKLLDLTTFEPLPITDFHNLREGTHALYALIKYRNDKKALEIAKQFIATIKNYYDVETDQWDEARFHAETGGNTAFTCGPFRSFPISFGRFIGPLVKLYKASGLAEALILAIQLKEYAFNHVINENGDYDVNVFGEHTHSTTAMLSSLAQLGEVLGDHSIYERVIAFMENGLNEIALKFGWCLENFYRTDHLGEINNTSDIMETCLILGKAGYTQYFQQAERILRAHFLPSQLLDTCFIPEWDCPEQDYRHKLASRARGAFGFPCPYGHEYEVDGFISFNWDIVGGGVGGLCEAYRDKVTKRHSMVSINLHFDHSDEDIEVTCPYTNKGVMVIHSKKEQVIRIRLSDWMVQEQLQVELEGGNANYICSDGWLYLHGVQAGNKLSVRFPHHISVERFTFRDSTFTIKWNGDAVEQMSSLGRRLCFFDEFND